MGTKGEGYQKATDKKTIERNRRIQMKELCSNLVSLIPSSHFVPPKEFLSQQDQIEQAASYIKMLKERVEELRTRKKTQYATATANQPMNGSGNGTTSTGSDLPILKITDLDPNLELLLITAPTPSNNFITSQIIAIIEEEGANVHTVTLSNNGHRIIHTFHAQVKISRVGVDMSSLCRRIEELVS